ncbi:hypothetical protein HMPREF2863_00115 [Micrococcus sp. HMSC067E09]|uniref:site-2 protease family protein n=1 Tax=Micrococcus sp. HMSC067E09 TaxID=1739367 RepID=UPI0008A1F72A|nr:site-2 protease family protein [Micrococcus sp. HMSC067E09]OFR86670.1 hypothetical protein HMPREF2863_00115 [Micrococcus sp. HMSC067E09]
MTGTSAGLRLGSLGGAPIVVGWAWLLIGAAVLVIFGPSLQRADPSLGWAAYAVAGGYVLVLAVSVLIHELAHAAVGAAHGSRPEAIELSGWGGHTQFVRAVDRPLGSVLTALAGPAANLVLAGLAHAAGTLAAPGTVTALLLSMAATANLLLAAFNVLPGLPLDGGRMIESAVWAATGSRPRGTVAAGWAGRVLATGLVLGGIAVPLLTDARPGLGVVALTVLVGVSLYRGADAAIASARWQDRAARITVGDLMLPAVLLAPDATVADAEAALRTGGTAVVLEPAVGEGTTTAAPAVVDVQAVRRVPQARRALTPATAVAAALPASAVLRLGTDPESGPDLIDRLAATDTAVWAVVRTDGRVLGILPRAAVLNALEHSPPRHRRRTPK